MSKIRTFPLSELPSGAAARVTGGAVSGFDARRLTEYGLIKGTRVKALFRAPGRRPLTAYGIRGAVIALRADLAARITVRPEASE